MIVDDKVRIELTIDNEHYDISHLLLAGSLHVQELLCNSDYKSTLNSASWSINWDDICLLIRDSENPIYVKIWHGEFLDILFEGQMDPVISEGWDEPEHPDSVAFEAVDFTVAMDKKLSQSINYPAAVDGEPFFIYRKGYEDMSILYKLLELAGLSDRISDNAPDIDKQVLHVAATKDTITYRNIIDPLLAEYCWVIAVIDGDKITWSKTALKTIDETEIIDERNILASGSQKFSMVKRYDVHDGVLVEWPQTKIMEDALLWRGNLPIGDTSDPFPGESIAAGDYWPEDSDVIETWADFESTFLDTDYLTGATRLKGEDIGLIASSNQSIQDTKDDGVTLDPITEDVTIVYESLRARLRYKNTGVAALKLYWSEIYGKALVQTSLPETKYPTDCSDPKEYPVSYIFDLDSAQALVEALWIRQRKGCFDIKFPSLNEYTIGSVYKLRQGQTKFDGFVLITGRSRSYDFGGVWIYQAVSIAAVETITSKTASKSKSGGPTVAQDGASTVPYFTRSATLPETPVGSTPVGWTVSVPSGNLPIWLSYGKFSSSGDQIGNWTTPIKVSGIDKVGYVGTSLTGLINPVDGEAFLYTGETTVTRKKYHYYKYSTATDTWAETTESSVVMAGLKDAFEIADNTGEFVYAAAIYVTLMAAQDILLGNSFRSDYYNKDGTKNLASTATKGVYMNADGNFAAHNGIFSGLLLSAIGRFTGSFSTPAISSEPEEVTVNPYSAAGGIEQARTMSAYIINTLAQSLGSYIKMSGTFQGKTVIGGVITVESSQGRIHIYDYYSMASESITLLLSNSDGSTTTLISSVSKTNINPSYYPDYPTVDVWTDELTYGSTFTETLALDIYTGGDVLTMKNLPTSAYGLTAGRIWNDSGTLKIVN